MGDIERWLDSEAVNEHAARALITDEAWEDDWMTAMNVVGVVLEALKSAPDQPRGAVSRGQRIANAAEILGELATDAWAAGDGESARTLEDAMVVLDRQQRGGKNGSSDS